MNLLFPIPSKQQGACARPRFPHDRPRAAAIRPHCRLKCRLYMPHSYLSSYHERMSATRRVCAGARPACGTDALWATPACLPTMRTMPGSLAACRQRDTKVRLASPGGRDTDVLTTRGIKKAVAVCGTPICARQNPQTLNGRKNKSRRIRFRG